MPLMTGRSIPHPHGRSEPQIERRAPFAGEEIVHSRRKRRGRVNPLVVGSNPTGPRLDLNLQIRGAPERSAASFGRGAGTFVARSLGAGPRRALGLPHA